MKPTVSAQVTAIREKHEQIDRMLRMFLSDYLRYNTDSISCMVTRDLPGGGVIRAHASWSRESVWVLTFTDAYDGPETVHSELEVIQEVVKFFEQHRQEVE